MKKKIGTAMIVGAGISGIRSALDLAEFGYQVTLVDKAPHIGGILSQLDYQFPNDGCGMCKMLPMIDRDASSQLCLRKGLFHENIQIILDASLTALEGEPGKFKATLEQKKTSIDPDLCIGCGQCTTVCPVNVSDAFNMGIGSRKAIYLPIPHNIPNTYVIDFSHCNRCGECVTACPTGAIKLPEERRKRFKILVVDDELIVRDSLKEWLEDEGFSVDMADSGTAALDLLDKNSYHLMLTDIKMPGMDGVEVLKQASENHPDLTIVMMTAYATVETAVEAMKTGATDYLLKPFDPRTFTPKILEIYQQLDVMEEHKIDINAVVLSTGTAYFDPLESKDTFGYGALSDVVTSREFERLLSGTGPNHGHLVRLSDQQPVQKVAWFQCVGSRDLQNQADFCSSVCCMHAVKEARLVKEKLGSNVETTIFYMDMRGFGKSFCQYLDQAKNEHGVRFERSRVHSVIANVQAGGLQISYFDQSGQKRDEQYDMVVLSIGQRPSTDSETLSSMLGIDRNEWGFCQTLPFSTSMSQSDGIFLGGSFSGLQDISESIIQSSSAAFCASRFIHSNGGSISPEPEAIESYRDVSRELPRVLVMVCTCSQAGLIDIDSERVKNNLMKDPVVSDVVFLEKACTKQGWDDLVATASSHPANRILIGTCLADAYLGKIKELSTAARIHPALIKVQDIRYVQHTSMTCPPDKDRSDKSAEKAIEDTLRTGFSSLRRIEPPTGNMVPSVQRALVLGGGIAGMTAALAICDHGFEVDLVEQADVLGGNLTWIKQTLDGKDVQSFLDETRTRVETHPLLHVHTQSSVTDSFGSAGQFRTTIEKPDQKPPVTINHGITILATGGTCPQTHDYGYRDSHKVVTHKELEEQLSDQTLDPKNLKSVVMIQCVDSREPSKKNYCSRVCCASALKNALHLKNKNPDIMIYVFYRDIMTYGFMETFYTQARKKRIVFIKYDLENKPVACSNESNIRITGSDPILGRPIEIEADLLVLATGILPNVSKSLMDGYGARIDPFGFFEEAESKWRPVDSLKEGVFACGLCHSPRNITESVSSAQAAAQRGLRILADTRLTAGTVTAQVRGSLCSLCGRCVDACPYDARSLDLDLKQAVVNPIMCQGCGSCAAVCPNSATVLAGHTDQQVFDQIDSVF